jgi:hypothetical protein
MSSASERALRDIGVLQQVFSHLGQGYWLFASPVSKLWKELYEHLQPPPVPFFGHGIKVSMQRIQNFKPQASEPRFSQQRVCERR